MIQLLFKHPLRLADKETFNVDGIELLNFINQYDSKIKTVVITGYPDSIKREPECDAFILKVPEGSTFDSNGFKKLVRDLLLL